MGENAQILIKHNRRTVRKLAKELGEAFAQCESLRKNLLEFSHSAKVCGRTCGSFRTVRKFAEELAEVFALFDGLRKNLRKLSHFSTACGRSSGNFLTFQRLAEEPSETFSLFSGISKITAGKNFSCLFSKTTNSISRFPIHYIYNT